jgi:ADP-ribose pyrophosphatase YjhB (NUDIX family)
MTLRVALTGKAAELSKHRVKRRPGKVIPTTRVSVVVLTDDEKILLVRHRKGNRQYWVLPGGRLEYGETFQECAVRELKEETGLEVKVDKLIFLSEAIAPDRSRHIVNVYLTARVTGGTLKLGNEPVLAGVDYVSVSELERVTLYPPVGKKILENLAGNFEGGIEYLGNLWV